MAKNIAKKKEIRRIKKVTMVLDIGLIIAMIALVIVVPINSHELVVQCKEGTIESTKYVVVDQKLIDDYYAGDDVYNTTCVTLEGETFQGDYIPAGEKVSVWGPHRAIDPYDNRFISTDDGSLEKPDNKLEKVEQE